MSSTWKDAPEVEGVAIELIREHHHHLIEAEIKYLFRTGPWSTQHRETWGKATKVSGQNQYLTGYDFIITISEEVWWQLTLDQKKALVDHELMHCCRGDDKDDGSPSFYIQGHDFEDFVGVIRRHGLWSEGLKLIRKVQEDRNQITLEEAIEAAPGEVAATNDSKVIQLRH